MQRRNVASQPGKVESRNIAHLRAREKRREHLHSFRYKGVRARIGTEIEIERSERNRKEVENEERTSEQISSRKKIVGVESKEEGEEEREREIRECRCL